MSTALVVMARYPESGAVKTRLIPRLGAAGACALYRAFLDDIGRRFAHRAAALIWACWPPERDLADVVGHDARCISQVGADLGARMHHVFQELCSAGFARVIMIGADAPHIRDTWLEDADGALDAADVVLGPSRDGGYYLIGMRAPHDVFSGIEMSTPYVLARTCDKAAAAGLRVHLIAESFDVDELDDLLRLRRLLADDPDAPPLPATRAALRTLVGDHCG